MMRLRRRNRPDRARSSADPDRSAARIADLEQRLEHLEAAFEGLQDSVHREFVRQDKLVHELSRSTQPAAMARALSDDARRRGV